MNISIVGDFSPNLDEGYKNTSHYLAAGLEQRHTVQRLNHKQLACRHFWKGLISFSPDIVHAVTQPTDQSLLLTRLLRARWPGSRTVLSALRADRYFVAGRISPKHQVLMHVARPDLVLVQSTTDETLFRRLGCVTRYLPNGVDLDRFKPIAKEERLNLRAKYDLDVNRPVVLHIGHLETSRNLLSLQRLPQAGIQVLIVGSLYMAVHGDLIRRLEEAGFRVLKGYQPHVEELYQLSDLYVFPVEPGNSLTMPLSVLEAMACGLPVLATRFAGLEYAFAEGRGFRFIDHGGNILTAVEEALRPASPINTRQMVARHSWPTVIGQLEQLYEGLLGC